MRLSVFALELIEARNFSNQSREHEGITEVCRLVDSAVVGVDGGEVVLSKAGERRVFLP